VVVLGVLGDKADVGKKICGAISSPTSPPSPEVFAAGQVHQHSRICLNMESSDFDLKERDNSLGVSLSSKQSAFGTDSLRNSMNDKCARPFRVWGSKQRLSRPESAPTDCS